MRYILAILLFASVGYSVPLRDDDDIRYITVKDNHASLVSFVLNSISTKREIKVPVVTNDKLSFRLSDYNIDPALWDKFTNYRPIDSETVLQKMTGETYYKFLGIENLADLDKLLGRPDQEAAFIKLEKNIFRLSFNTLVQRFPTTSGYYWRTTDSTSGGWEFTSVVSCLGSLRNGMIAYALVDHKGKLLPEIPPDIAADMNGKVVTVVHSCIGCHAEGVKEFETKNPKWRTAIRHDQDKYKEAVGLATGLSPKKISEFYNKNEFSVRCR